MADGGWRMADGGCLKVGEIEPRRALVGVVSVFEKSNDSCQGSWLKVGEEESET